MTGGTSRTAARPSARSGKSLVPVSASLRRATAASRSARTAATCFWIRPGFERSRRRRPPARSPETATRLCDTGLTVRASMPPEPAAGSDTRGEVRTPPAERVAYCARRGARTRPASPIACGEWQYRNGIGAAEAGGDRGDGLAQHVHVRVALRHHSPRGFGDDEGGLRRKPADLFDPRPKFPHRAELGDGEEFVGIGGKTEIDHAARVIERAAARFQRPKVGDGDSERIRQLLRFRAARIVDHPAVRGRERPAKALRGEA